MRSEINIDPYRKISHSLFIILTMVPAVTLISCESGSAGSNSGSSEKRSPNDTVTISFTEYEHDFGTVTAGEKVACVFTFENRGNSPLVISSATTSCGCTVSRYNTKPVSPGGKGTVEVIFDSSGMDGRQTKTITIRSNATRSVVFLKITGLVKSGNNN